jgi:hypothetical protein
MDQVVEPGEQATFHVQVLKPDGLVYQWHRDGTPIESADATALILSSVEAEMEGAYAVRISDGLRVQWSQAASLRVPGPVVYPGAAVRSLPTNYYSGNPVEVRVEVQPPVGTEAWTLIELVPRGWSIQENEQASSVDPVQASVHFGPFEGDAPQTLAYIVVPPFERSDTVDFFGEATFDQITNRVEGDVRLAGIKEWEFMGPQVLATRVEGIAYGAGRWVASGFGWVTTSQDGTRWTYPQPVAPMQDESWTRLDFLGGRFLLWGIRTSGSSQRPAILASEDGLSWSVDEAFSQLDGTGYVESITYGNGIYVAVGWNHPEGARHGGRSMIWRSRDGYRWTRAFMMPDTRRLMGASFGDGRFLVVGQNKTILTSENGQQWEEVTDAMAFEDLPENTHFQGVGYGGSGWLITMSPSGRVLRSGDGSDWEILTVPGFSGSYLYKSFWADDRYWFNGPSSAWTTPDGVTWTQSVARLPHVSGVERVFTGVEAVAPDGVRPRIVAGGQLGHIVGTDDGEVWRDLIPRSMSIGNVSWSSYHLAVADVDEWLIGGRQANFRATSGPNWAPPSGSARAWWQTLIQRSTYRVGSRPTFSQWIHPLPGATHFIPAAMESPADHPDPVVVGFEEGGGGLGAGLTTVHGSSHSLATFQATAGGLPIQQMDHQLHGSIVRTESGWEIEVESIDSQHFLARVMWGHFTSTDGMNWQRRSRGLNYVDFDDWLVSANEIQVEAWVPVLMERHTTPTQRVWDELSDAEQQAVMNYAEQGTGQGTVQAGIVAALNRLIEGASIYSENAFADFTLSEETRLLVEVATEGPALRHLNRRLFEDAFGLQRRMPQPIHVRGMVLGDGRFVAVTGGFTPGGSLKRGRIFVGDDPEYWTEVDLGSQVPELGNEGFTSIAFGNGHFVVTGNNGRILRSNDGLIWETAMEPLGPEFGWNRIRFLNNEWVALGQYGRIAFSRDIVSWDERPVGVQAHLRDIAIHEGTYLVVGSHGMVLTAPARTAVPYFSNPIRFNKLAYGEGSIATLLVEADGSDPIQYQWFRDGVPVPDASVSSLMFPVDSSDDGALFTVVASNEFGFATNGPVVLRVVDGIAPVAYSIPNGDSEHPLRDRRYTGLGDVEIDNAELSGGVGDLFDGIEGRWPGVDDGIHEELHQWVGWRNLDPEIDFDFGQSVSISAIRIHTVHVPSVIGLPQAVGVSFSDNGESFGEEHHFEIDPSDFPIHSQGYLRLPILGNGRFVRVRLERFPGIHTLVAASEFRFEADDPPMITLDLEDFIVLPGDEVRFLVAAEGTPPLSYTWYKDNEQIPEVDGPELHITSVEPADAGSYHVVIANAATAVSSRVATLIVVLPPEFQSHPVDISRLAGESALFEVSVTGTAPITFEWFHNNQQIEDANSSQLIIADVTAADAGSYHVVVTNELGEAHSTSAVLTVLFPATVDRHPTHFTLANGQSAQFSVTASGTPPLMYQWFHAASIDGPVVPIPDSDSGTLLVEGTGPEDAGYYSVLVTNAYGEQTSHAAVLTVVPPSSGFVTRRLPGGYLPGRPIEVLLDVRPDPTLLFYAVEDMPPSGWTVEGINQSGTYDPVAGRVRYAFFADNAARTLRYTVVPTLDAVGRAEFSGTASADGIELPIDGAEFIDVVQTHPADSDMDLSMVTSEVHAYGEAWMRGTAWPQPPNPIPMAYLTRAGFLAASGGGYRLDITAGDAPFWWVPDSTQPTGRRAFLASSVDSRAERHVSEHRVWVEVQVPESTVIFAVQERLPIGFRADAVNHGGTFDSAAGLVRWGPFTDDAHRVLEYTLHAPDDFIGETALVGTLSVDGADALITGDDVVVFGTSNPLRGAGILPEGTDRRLILNGPMNSVVTIEVSESLAAPWSLLTEFLITQPRQEWQPPANQAASLYYRVMMRSPDPQ